jgi:formylglycine-generating enzyme required for sulfatase activity
VASVAGGSVTTVLLTSGGSGYGAPPAVTFVGGGGTGATAVAHVSLGAVTQIILQTPGAGYTNAPIVAVAPPPLVASPALLNIRMVPELVVTGQAWQVQSVQYTDLLGDTNQWVTWTNVVMGNAPLVLFDTNAPSATRFYRVVTLGAPGPDPTRWAWLNPGSFTMGSPETEYDRSADEGPQTRVTFTYGFWMERFELTEAEYTSIVGTNGAAFQSDSNQPMEEVSWLDGTNYCARLTSQEQTAGRLPPGYVYRLPTEAEWEYACRAGTTTRFPFGDDRSYTLLLNYAWVTNDSGAITHDVGTKLPNPWGVYDMSGNVWEWCADLYGPYSGGSVTNPVGAASGTYVVMRGGSVFYAGDVARSAARNFNSPTFFSHGIGIRVVLGPPLH